MNYFNVVNIDFGFKLLMFLSSGILGGFGGKFFCLCDINVIISKIVIIVNKIRKIFIFVIFIINRIR